jgi:hypothetical protein
MPSMMNFMTFIAPSNFNLKKALCMASRRLCDAKKKRVGVGVLIKCQPKVVPHEFAIVS